MGKKRELHKKQDREVRVINLAAQRETEQERLQALAFRPVLTWMVENGTPDTVERAQAAQADWANNKTVWQQWGTKSGYLRMLDRARTNIDAFKKAMKTLPMNEMEQRMNTWVLEAALLLNRKQGYNAMPKRIKR